MKRIGFKDKSSLIIPSLLVALVVFAILDSTILYSLQVNQEAEIIDLSKRQVITNLSRESLQVSQIAELRIQRVVDWIDNLTKDPSVEQHNYDRIPLLLQSTQSATSDITSSYFIIDKDGILIHATDSHVDINPVREKLPGYSIDIQENPAKKVYIINSMRNPDPMGRIYVTSSIINQETGEFDGVMGATLRTDVFVRNISSSLGLRGDSDLELTDNDGNLIYSSRVPDLVGKSLVSDDYLHSSIQGYEIENFISSINKARSGWTGFFELSDRDASETKDRRIVAYSPVKIGGDIVLLTFVSSPTNADGIIMDVLVAERSYTRSVVYSILAILGFFAVVIIIINKKLRNLVKIRTKELEKANEELKHRDRLKDEFISIASHELRSPIQPILGFAELAKRGRINQNEAWDGILRHSQRLQKLANDILDVSRIESNDLTYEMEKFKINEVIRDVINSAQVNLNGLVSIESRLDKDVEIEADKDRIIQVLSNIIDNAIKFTKKGAIKVETSIFPETNKIQIKISDTGGGIPSDILPQLFDKFVTKSVDYGDHHGTGLGLFISKAIVTAHKGEIFVYNNDEGGATIAIVLPIINNYEYELKTHPH